MRRKILTAIIVSSTITCLCSFPAFAKKEASKNETIETETEVGTELDYDEFFEEQEEFLSYLGYKGDDLDDLRDDFEKYNIQFFDEEDEEEFETYGTPDPQTVVKGFPDPIPEGQEGCPIYVFDEVHECQAYSIAYVVALHDRTGFKPTRVKGDLKVLKNTLVVISGVEGKPAMALFMFDFDIPE